MSVVETDTVTGEVREIKMKYDRRHLLTEMRDGAGNITNYQYRADGKVTGRTQGPWEWEYGYDAGGWLNQLTRRKEGENGQYQEIYNHRYTGSGRENRSVTVNGTGTTEYRYDAYGRVVGVMNAIGEVSNRTLSPAGRLRSEQGASGGNFVYQYDASGRLTGAGREGQTAVRVTYNRDGRQP